LQRIWILCAGRNVRKGSKIGIGGRLAAFEDVGVVFLPQDDVQLQRDMSATR